MLLTRESMARFQTSRDDLQKRGLFYRCDCTDDLQPMSKQNYDLLRVN